MSITVLAPGPLTTVQDEGRFGRQRYGLSPAGAMDFHSLALANLLVGNPIGTGALEATFAGPALRFDTAAVFAVTGADMCPTLDGTPVPMGQAFPAPAGSVLKLGTCKTGVRSYIAFHGGLDIPLVQSSQSTLVRGGVGGFQGRRLMAGDRIGLAAPAAFLPGLSLRRLPEKQLFPKDVTLRVVLGPQEERFTAAGLQTFLQKPFTVSPRSDRMAVRLEGQPIEHRTDANIISDGIPLGAVQVPDSGTPIIMMSEHQGSGGYTKIATVISSDIPLIAQCSAGYRVRFEAVSVEQAQAIYLERRAQYAALEQYFSQIARHCRQSYGSTLNGRPFSVEMLRG